MGDGKGDARDALACVYQIKGGIGYNRAGPYSGIADRE